MSNVDDSDCGNDSVMKTEGPLANKLHAAFDMTCKKYISSIKFSLFKKKYKDIYNKDPEALISIYDQLCFQLSKTINEDLNELCQEHSIDMLLNSLDTIKKGQNPTQNSWRPSENPEQNLRDHVYPIKLKHKEILQEMLTKAKVENEELVSKVTINHGQIMHMKKTTEDMHEKFSNIINSITGSNLNKLDETLKNINES